MVVITPKADTIRPMKGESALGFVAEKTLKALLPSSEKGGTRRFELIIFLARSVKDVLGIIGKVISERLRSGGIVVLVSDDREDDVIPLIAKTIPSMHLVRTTEVVKKLFPSEETILALK